MIDNDVLLSKTLDEYKVFPSNYIQIEWIYDYIRKYKVDPCNHKTITNAINILEKELKEIKLPEKHSPSENIITTPSGRKRRLISKRDMIESELYIGMTNEEGNATFRKYVDIEFVKNILNRWLIITKVYFPDGSKFGENKQEENIKKIKGLLIKADKNAKQNVANVLNVISNLSKKVSPPNDDVKQEVDNIHNDIKAQKIKEKEDFKKIEKLLSTNSESLNTKLNSIDKNVINLSKKVITPINDVKQEVANMLNEIKNSFTEEKQSHLSTEGNDLTDLILKITRSNRPKEILYIQATYLSHKDQLSYIFALREINKEKKLLDPIKISDNDYTKWRTNNIPIVDMINDYINKIRN